MEPYKWYPQRAGRVDLVLPRAKETGKINDPVIRQEIAKLLIMSKSAEWTARRARAAQEQGKPQGPEGSLGKLVASHVARQAARVHTYLTGADALLSGEDSPMNGVIAEILISVPASSIAGGTDEIQRNIISERVLKMPRETSVDTNKPFKDVPRNIVSSRRRRCTIVARLLLPHAFSVYAARTRCFHDACALDGSAPPPDDGEDH